MYKCTASHTAKHFSIGGGNAFFFFAGFAERVAIGIRSMDNALTPPPPPPCYLSGHPFWPTNFRCAYDYGCLSGGHKTPDRSALLLTLSEKKKWEWRREHLVTQRRMFILARFESRKTIPITLQCNATDDTLQARSV
jgi:hypothetical protein